MGTPLTRLLSPRRLRRAVTTLRHDVAWIRTRGGGPTATVHALAPKAERERGLSLSVTEVVEETADASTIRLMPQDAGATFAAGQFLTFKLRVGQETLRRSYSLSSAPGDGLPWAITVKRVPEGRASGWLTRQLQVGDTLDAVGPPSGRFVLRPEAGRARRLLLVAGGSGITPILSILKTALVEEPLTRLALIYGNRSRPDVIFRTELDRLARGSGGRLRVRHVLEEAPASHRGGRGRLEPTVMARELDLAERWLGAQGTEGVQGEPVESYLCGPAPMMDAARQLLLQRGLTASRIHEERFQRAAPSPSTATGPHLVVLRVGGAESAVSVAAGQTLLEAAVSAGVPMPFTCTMGGCGACRVRVHSGELVMEGPGCLSEDEQADGWRLACVSRCGGPAIVEVES